MQRILRSGGLLFFLLLIVAACGGEAPDSPDSPSATGAPAEAGGLSAAQLENGIGPVQNLTLETTVDQALVAQGEAIFRTKCTACHKMAERYVGPPLGDVLEKRTPAYVMNMILNPAEMLEKHPEARGMLAQYLTPMPDQNLTEEEARAVLEFLRTNQGVADSTAQ